MKKTYLLVVLFGFYLMGCSSISDAINSLLEDCQALDAGSLSAAEAAECSGVDGLFPEAQDTLETRIEVFYADPDSGQTYFWITDDSGSPIQGLDDTRVTLGTSTDNGDSFTTIDTDEIATFEQIREEEPLTPQFSLATVVDHSGSISDSNLSSLDDGMSVLFENMEAVFSGAIVKFSDSAELTTDFTTDVDTLLDDLTDSSFERSSTALFDGLNLGVQSVVDSDFDFRLAVLFTDGADNSSSVSYSTVRDLFQENHIPVLVIGVGFADISTLQDIAEDSNGFLIYIVDFVDLTTVFEQVATQIENIYRVSSDAFPDGTTDVRVQVETDDVLRSDTLTL